jgi:putative peptidoglycan lipid II flippase
VHSDHRAIARAMALVALYVLFASLARGAKEIAIAYRYGVSAEVDAYLFVFNLVTWPVGVWFSVLTVVLVPLATRLQQSEPDAMPRFRSELLGLTLLLGLVLVMLAWLVLTLLLKQSWIGLPAATLEIALNSSLPLVILAPLGMAISLWSAWMLTAGRHANTMLESVPALTILCALLAFPSKSANALVWATLAGYIFHLTALGVPLVRSGEVNVPRLTRRSPYWTPFWKGFSIMLVGQLLMSLVIIVDQFFAAHLQTGSIAVLSYANRVLTLILGLGSVAVSRATLPIFSRAESHGYEHLHAIAKRWTQIMFIIGSVAMLVCWFLAPWGVKTLFERGAFEPKDTAIVQEILRYGLIQLPFYFASLVIVSSLVSQERYFVISVIGALNLILKIILSALLVASFGVAGLMISSSLMAIFSSLLLSFVFFKTIKRP